MELTQSNSVQTQDKFRSPVIKVVGLGGAGCNTINHLMELNLPGIECIAANTDVQVLQQSQAPTRIQLGPILTRGLGSGGDPQIGEGSAEESYQELDAALRGADLVFLTAGMGGGTGTGSISIAARLAHSIDAVVISIVSTPFSFESGKRQINAREGIARLRPYSDTLIVVPNDRLLQVAPLDLPMEMAFRLSDDVLRQAIQSISELVTQTGLINIDFAHILRIMRLGGGAYIAIGHGQGEGKAQQAIQSALNHPLLESIQLDQAKGVIISFSGSSNLSMNEMVSALNDMRQRCHPDAEIIPGMTNDPQMQDRVQAILIVTGVGGTPIQNPNQAAAELYVSTTDRSSHRPSSQKPNNKESLNPIKASEDELEVPAFIRRRNQILIQDHRTNG